MNHMPENTQIREVTDRDMARITEIYAHYVRTSVITFEYDPPSVEEMSLRRTRIQEKGLPYLVAEVDGDIAGFAYAAPFRARYAYRFSVEDTVYLDPAQTGRGLGKQLLSALIDTCTEKGYRQMIGIVAGRENLASINLHKSLGFEFKGTAEAVGYKFDRWIDTLHLQRPLGPGDQSPPH